MEAFVPLSEAWDDVRLGRPAARRILRCDEARLDRLCRQGLPSRGEGREQTFGECDVMNAGLAAGGGRSVPELARRRTLGFAAADPRSWVCERAWKLVVVASCACGDDRGAWSIPRPRPELYGGGVDSSSLSERADGVELGLELRTGGRRGPFLPPEVEEEMDAVFAEFDAGALRFHYLPAALRRDPARAVGAGVVDCVALTMHLARRLSGRGLEVATRRGHLLSGVGVEHAWLELGGPSSGAAVDPMLAVLARGAKGVHPRFQRFCLGSVSNRVLPWDRSAGEPLFVHACGRAPAAPPKVTVSARGA